MTRRSRGREVALQVLYQVEQNPEVPVVQAVAEEKQGSRLHEVDEVGRDDRIFRTHSPKKRDVVLLGDNKGVFGSARAADMAVDLK